MAERITSSANLQGFSDIRRNPISGWQEFFKEGEAYLKTGTAAHVGGRKAFTPDILYNIIAMAIEKFAMAALMHRGALPYNHTMGDLVEALRDVIPESISGIEEGLLALDSYQEICDVDSFRITPPTVDEIPEILGLAWELRQSVDGLINSEKEPIDE